MRIDPTAAGLRDMWLPTFNGQPSQPSLCYGRKHVVAVRLERRDVGVLDGTPKMGYVLRYDYTIVDAPAWTARADIRTAFPFLQRELGRVRTAEQPGYWSGKRWELTADNGPEVNAELPDTEWFSPEPQAAAGLRAGT